MAAFPILEVANLARMSYFPFFTSATPIFANHREIIKHWRRRAEQSFVTTDKHHLVSFIFTPIHVLLERCLLRRHELGVFAPGRERHQGIVEHLVTERVPSRAARLLVTARKHAVARAEPLQRSVICGTNGFRGWALFPCRCLFPFVS